jgi:hypothetical protein
MKSTEKSNPLKKFKRLALQKHLKKKKKKKKNMKRQIRYLQSLFLTSHDDRMKICALSAMPETLNSELANSYPSIKP